MKRRLLHLVVALMAFAATTMAQSLSVAPIEATPGTETTITVNIAGAAEMTALQCNLQLPEGLTLAGDITLGDAAKGHTLSTSTLASGDLLIVLYDLYQSTFTDGTLLTIPVVAAEDAASGEARLYTVHTATAAAVSHTLSDVTFAMNIASEEPEPTWHLSGPATEEEVTTQSYIDGLVYNQTTKPSTITLKKGYNVIIIPSSWTTPTFGFVSDFSKRYTPFTANDLGITNPSNKNVLVLYTEVENGTCYVKWGTNVVPEPEPEPEPEGLSTSKYYRVKNVTTGLYMQVSGNNTNMTIQNRAEGVELSQVFQLEDAGEGMYYIKAADLNNSYYAHASGWNFNATANAANKTPFTIALVEGETQVYTLHQSVSANTGLAGTDAAEAGAAIYCDKKVDNNGKWSFEALTEEENAAYTATLTATARQAVEEAIARGEGVAANRSAVLTAEETAAINNAVQAAKGGKDAAADAAALTALAEAIHTAVDEAVYVWNTDALSNAMCYAVSTEDRGAWYAQAANLTSTAKAGVAVDITEAKQQFAFVKSEKSGALYLYSVSEAKFVKKEGDYTALTEAPAQTIAILNGTRSAAFPWVVALNAEDGQKQMGISNGYDPAVITHWNDLGDGGNTVRIEKVAVFDASAALAAIEALENPVIAVTGITLSQTAATLTEGESLTLTATVAPEDATDKTVTWSSSNTAVATVDNNGVVTAVAAGTATITAKAGDKEATCVVTVAQKVIAVTGITLSQTAATLTEGETLTLTATVAPEDATDKTITWSSSDKSVATVDNNGKVTAVAAGTATITAKAGDKEATCVVTVEEKVPDSVDNLKTTDNGGQTTVIYDLAGRRVEKGTKGIYIVNGRKVVIR